MKEAIGVSADSWRSESDQRTERRGLALERKLIEQSSVHIGVRSRLSLDQITTGLDSSQWFSRCQWPAKFLASTGTADRTSTSCDTGLKTGRAGGHMIVVDRERWRTETLRGHRSECFGCRRRPDSTMFTVAPLTIAPEGSVNRTANRSRATDCPCGVARSREKRVPRRKAKHEC